eukprot:GHVT01066978.1.p1 GENE.GHVT01066978.1~~GHVT01066978.1.p1  ORF type:complete len:448 (+),score=98.02 GHVT01066978.1:925-2268(+)
MPLLSICDAADVGALSSFPVAHCRSEVQRLPQWRGPKHERAQGKLSTSNSSQLLKGRQKGGARNFQREQKLSAPSGKEKPCILGLLRGEPTSDIVGAEALIAAAARPLPAELRWGALSSLWALGGSDLLQEKRLRLRREVARDSPNPVRCLCGVRRCLASCTSDGSRRFWMKSFLSDSGSLVEGVAEREKPAQTTTKPTFANSQTSRDSRYHSSPNDGSNNHHDGSFSQTKTDASSSSSTSSYATPCSPKHCKQFKTHSYTSYHSSLSSSSFSSSAPPCHSYCNTYSSSSGAACSSLSSAPPSSPVHALHEVVRGPSPNLWIDGGLQVDGGLAAQRAAMQAFVRSRHLSLPPHRPDEVEYVDWFFTNVLHVFRNNSHQHAIVFFAELFPLHSRHDLVMPRAKQLAKKAKSSDPSLRLLSQHLSAAVAEVEAIKAVHSHDGQHQAAAA